MFHEKYASLGGKSSGKPFGAIWHEGTDGRSAEENTSTYSKIFRHPKKRDYKKIVLWVDNCGGQDKNWVLYSMFC